jgi:hypothetical protein
MKVELFYIKLRFLEIPFLSDDGREMMVSN